MDQQEMGEDLKNHNEKIVRCITVLREQRDELCYLIEKQREERNKLEMEIERLTYKLCLINKSLAQRVRAKENYDKTLQEIEDKYNKLVKNSGDLLLVVQKEFEELDSIINKKVSTDDNQTGDDETVSSSACTKREKDCKCEESKEVKNRKQTKAVIVDVELPTKLEKTEDGVSPSDSMVEKTGNAEDEQEFTGIKDYDSDDEHDYPPNVEENSK